jgi:hypothetical protein
VLSALKVQVALPLKSPLLKVTSLPLALLKFCWIEAMYELKSVSDQLPIRQSPGRLGPAVVAAGSALSVSAAEEGSEVLLPEEAPLQAASMNAAASRRVNKNNNRLLELCFIFPSLKNGEASVLLHGDEINNTPIVA